ncbi:MAG: NAD(P)/FAD-dependent oxidoreductase, partial [Candidatus Melainabacteria bacterium]|nr:NAD(P)/FAD-dependent oxidoreductase [Candidatus Melainabacteria bacterium]
MATKTRDEVEQSQSSQAEPITYDMLLVGGSPSNLTMAHRLCDLAKANPLQKISLAILEKAEEFGSHIVSGAVVNKAIFDKAYPNHVLDGMPIESVCHESHFSIMSENAKWDVPSVITRAALPDFVKEGYYILTLSRVVEWMAQTLEEKAKEIPNITIDLFPGFAAHEAIIEEDKVIGVRVGNSGDANEDNVYASLVAFGDKGFLSKDLIKHFGLEGNPQLWSVGVKETWKLAADADDVKGKVYHTLGYPTQDGTLGGGFVYGLDHGRLTIGLVISLDSKNPNIHPQKQLQEYKKHPWLQKLLKGAELLNYGAAVLPEGGLASLPKAFQVNGALILGDALGLLDMKSLAGVDKAIESGYLAAETAFKAVTGKDVSAQNLSGYQGALMHSPFMDKFKANRYFRKAFLDNPEILSQHLPRFLSGIELSQTPVIGGLLGPLIGGLNVALNSPFGALAQTIDAGIKMNLADDVKEEIKYKPGY